MSEPRTASHSMSLSAAFALQARLRASAPGVEVDVKDMDSVEAGEVVRSYRVVLSIADRDTGTSAQQTIAADTLPERVDIPAIIGQMRADLMARIANAKRARRVERQINRS